MITRCLCWTSRPCPSPHLMERSRFSYIAESIYCVLPFANLVDNVCLEFLSCLEEPRHHGDSAGAMMSVPETYFYAWWQAYLCTMKRVKFHWFSTAWAVQCHTDVSEVWFQAGVLRWDAVFYASCKWAPLLLDFSAQEAQTQFCCQSWSDSLGQL